MANAARNPFPLSPAEPESGPARDRVYRYVHDRILRGEYRGGSFIEEGAVSVALAVSRTPVREAFHRLESERLIDLVPRRGAVVRQVTAQELLDVYAARKLIECDAVRRICEQAIPIPPEMASLVERMRVTAEPFALRDLDREFHRVMVTAAGNAVLAELYGILRSRQQLIAAAAVSVHAARLAVAYEEHRELLDALTSRDAGRAVDAFTYHLRPMPELVAGLPAPETRA